MKNGAYLALTLMAAFLVSHTNGAADTLEDSEASAGFADEEFADTNNRGLEETLAKLSALAPPPQLSERALGIHTVSCLPGTAPGLNEVEGESYSLRCLYRATELGEPGRTQPRPGLSGGQGDRRDPATRPSDLSRGWSWRISDLCAQISTNIRMCGLNATSSFSTFAVSGSVSVWALKNASCWPSRMTAPADQITALQAAAVRFLAIANGEDTPSPPDLADLDLPLLNATCWEQFTSRGIDPNQFTTASSARDTVELIRALGHDAFNIEGASYGTRLAMTIMDNMAEYEDAPELRSVILDSTFPPSVYQVRTIVRSDHDFMLQLLDECQADAVCDGAYPNLAARLAVLLNRFEQTPLTVNGETVTIEDVVDQLTDVTNTRAGFIPRMIAELEGGCIGYLSRLARWRNRNFDPVEPLPSSCFGFE